MANLDTFVVDDEPLIASTLAEILRRNGYSAVSFTNPHDALMAIPDGCPKLLITDLKMPGLSGIDLAVRMRKSCSGCKILLFPGEANTSTMLREAREKDCESTVLRKPTSIPELLLTVHKIMGGCALT